MRVLVAEDDPVSRRLVARTLERAGLEPVLACDGSEAWQALSGDDPPRLALVDWMMPGIEGPALCRRVRTLEGPFYIILLTARGTPEEIAHGLEAGADDHVSKPFHPRELLARVQVGQRILDLQATLTRSAAETREAMARLTERTQALEESEARSRAAIENAIDAVLVIGAGCTIHSFNAAAERIFGWSREEAIGRTFEDVVLPERLRGTPAARQLGVCCNTDPARAKGRVEAVACRRDGTELPVDLAFTHLEGGLVFIVIRDLSETRRLEIELRHAQKLESVGQLAAGVAHEINTPMQFIGDNLRFLAESFDGLLRLLGAHRDLAQEARQGAIEECRLDELDEQWEREDVSYLEEEVPRALAQTLDGVERVATIVRAMKEFAHPDAVDEKMPADLNRALSSTLTVARNELKYVADVETEFGEIPSVVCNVGDLNQVFLNLLVNAAHAIADAVGDSGGRGVIRVRTAPDGEDGVVVSISDTGPGIPEEIRARIFDPFFTTKEVGRGTGQGLAIARNIVLDKHGGKLRFESAVGQGTTFFVHLPIDGGPAPAIEVAA